MTQGPFRYPDRAANADTVAFDQGGEYEAKGVVAQHSHTRRELGNIGAFAPEREGNKVLPFTTGEAYFANVCDAIAGASQSVFIIGWQVNWAVLLKGSTRLIDALKSASDKGAKLYVMPWLSPKAGLNTGDFSTMLAVFQLNAGKSQPTAFCCPAGLQNDYEGVEEAFFSHHQKLVVVDNRIAFVGGIDLAFGRRDDANFSLAHGWRKGPEIYNTGVPPLHKSLPTEAAAYVDESELLATTIAPGLANDVIQAQTRGSNALLKRTPVGAATDWAVDQWRKPIAWGPLVATKAWVGEQVSSATEPLARRADAAQQGAADRVVSEVDRGLVTEQNIGAVIAAARDVVRASYRALLLTSWATRGPNAEVARAGTQSAPNGGAVLEPDQPRMPWQDVHVRIEGPSVYDLSMNFIRRWNSLQASYLSAGLQTKTLISGALMPQEPAKGKGNGGSGGVKIDVLRSAPLQLQQDEFKAMRGLPTPVRAQDEIHDAMVAAIRDAEQFIYIENQFFQSEFGQPSVNAASKAAMSGPMRYMLATPGNRISAAMTRAGASHKGQGPQNHVSRAIADRIEHAIRWDENFHAYLVLPVHPEGSLADIAIVGQIHWTMQSLVFGSESLVNRVRLALYAKKNCKDARDEGQWAEAKRKGLAEVVDQKDRKRRPQFLAGTATEDVAPHLTFLNLRSCQTVRGNVLTEQAYIHSKLLIVDDRIVIVGSANINDRSLNGGRDSELAVVMTDLSTMTVPLDGSHPTKVRKLAHEMRVSLWKKHFGLSGGTDIVKPASQLAGVLDKPAAPATWQAIQAIAKANATAYGNAFKWVPQSESSIWPVWDRARKFSDETSYFDVSKAVEPSAKQMPFAEEFWKNPPRVTAPAGIKGFVCELPLEWTSEENNHPGMNMTLLTERGAPANAQGNTTLASTEPAGRSGTAG
jgi:phospholipase D1/2